MANIVPIPEDLPTRAAVDALTAASTLSAGGSPRTSPVVRYFGAIRRVKWLVLLLTLAGLGGGIVVSRLKPESYEIYGGLMLSPDQSSPFIGSQYRSLITQYNVIEPIVRDRRLYIEGPKRRGGAPLPPGPSGIDKDLFNGFDLDSSLTIPGDYRLKISTDRKTWDLTNSTTLEKDHGIVGDSVGRKFGFHWAPVIIPRWAGESFDFTVFTPREAADEIRKRLKVLLLPAEAPRFMSLTLTGQEGPPTAQVLNDLMERFVQQTSATKSLRLTTEAHVSDSMLRAARARLEDDERKLLTQKVKTITLPRDQQQIAVAGGVAETTPLAFNYYQSQQMLLKSYQKDRRDLATALKTLLAGQPAYDLFAPIPAFRNSPELSAHLQDLLTEERAYQAERAKGRTDDYADKDGIVNMPKKIARIKELRTIVVPASTQMVIQNLDSLIARTSADVNAASTDLEAIPQRTIDENGLVRERDMDAKIVGDLTNQWVAAKGKEASATTDVSLTDRAIAPLRPNTNKTSVIIALGTLIGLGLGLGLALLLDLTDKRLRYAEQVTTGLGLTILGVIPEIRRAKGQQPTVEEAAQVIEAFRTVRLNLSHTIGQGNVVLTVSSPSPGDGKSLVASNLALSFAESGYRTLLIDGDSRRGELHRTFGAERRPGLLDYLVGELPMEKLLRTTTHEQLSLITSGSRRRNAPELLGTARMRELIAKMKADFDVVLIDSPPMGAGIDPFVLGTLTGNLMLVLRAGATEKDLAETKLQVVDQLPIRLVGAVLNDVRTTMNDYKYYSYTYGYGAVDEPKEQTSITAKAGS